MPVLPVVSDPPSQSSDRRSRTARPKVIAIFVTLAVGAYVVSGGKWVTLIVVATLAVATLALIPRFSSLALPVATYVGVWLVFNVLRARADDTPWAQDVMDIVPNAEAWFWRGGLPSAFLQDAFFQPGNVDYLDYVLTSVYLSFFIVPHLTALVLLWRNRPKFWRYTIASAVLFTVAFTSFFALPTSPPWMVTQAFPTAGFSEVKRVTEDVLASMNLPFQLFGSTQVGSLQMREVRMEPNPIAAMPSIHFASTALVTLAVIGTGVWRSSAAVLYLLLMGLALVYMGEHYVLDLIIGGLFAGGGWLAAGRCICSEQPSDI